jgi:hypothetical protein
MFDSNHVQNDFIYQTGGSMRHDMKSCDKMEKIKTRFGLTDWLQV